MKFWQTVSWSEADQLAEIAQHAEELGFHGILISDHILCPAEMRSRYPYSENGSPPMNADWPHLDCWTAIAAMAAVTTRILFSTIIYILPLRHPIEVAKTTSTLAAISGNRLILGAGVGWMREEFESLGVDFSTRGRRMNEAIAILRRLWTGDFVEHRGEFFHFPPIRIVPTPAKPIPIYTGGSSPIALKRAARMSDGWIGHGNTPEEAMEVLDKLQALRVEAGREHLPFETIVGLTGSSRDDTLKRLEERGMTGAVSYPFQYALGLNSSLKQKIELMERFSKQHIRETVL